jgi:tRNA 2-thiouridine synthesizing protein A
MNDDVPESPERTRALLEELPRLAGRACPGCARAVCGHEAVMSVVLGYKDAPRCARCLAGALGRKPEELRDQLADYIERRDCFRSGWAWAQEREGFADPRRPACLWPEEGPMKADVEWDAGDMGCGELVLELRMRLEAMRPGGRIKLTARDPGAPEDMPAWCRLTGHALVSAKHPVYWIQRKEG